MTIAASVSVVIFYLAMFSITDRIDWRAVYFGGADMRFSVAPLSGE